MHPPMIFGQAYAIKKGVIVCGKNILEAIIVLLFAALKSEYALSDAGRDCSVGQPV